MAYNARFQPPTGREMWLACAKANQDLSIEFLVLCVFGAIAFDIRNFICECRVRRCDGTEKEVLLEFKVLWENRPLSRDTIELFAVFIELAALRRVSDTGEGVCQRVLRSGNPLRVEV